MEIKQKMTGGERKGSMLVTIPSTGVYRSYAMNPNVPSTWEHGTVF